MIQCGPKKYLVRTNSKSLLVDTKTEDNTKTKQSKLKGRNKKHGKTGKLKGQKIKQKHGHHKRKLGGDYIDNNYLHSKCHFEVFKRTQTKN